MLAIRAVMNYFYILPFSDVRSCHVLPWWVSKQLLGTMILCPLCSCCPGSPLASPLLLEFQAVRLCRFVSWDTAFFHNRDWNNTIFSSVASWLEIIGGGICVKKGLSWLPVVRAETYLPKGRTGPENVPLDSYRKCFPFRFPCNQTSICENTSRDRMISKG